MRVCDRAISLSNKGRLTRLFFSNQTHHCRQILKKYPLCNSIASLHHNTNNIATDSENDRGKVYLIGPR